MAGEEQFVFTTDRVELIKERENTGYKITKQEKFWLDNEKGVRKNGLIFSFSDDELLEYAKCKYGVDKNGDPYTDEETQELEQSGIQYFAETFCKIKNEMGKTMNIRLRPYQKKMLDLYTYNRFSVVCAARQAGKTITASITILYYCIFNNKKNVLIAGNIRQTAEEIINKIKDIYYELPFFLKPGVKIWNQSKITFGDTKCVIKTSATTKSAAIGNTIDFLYLDEFAHVPDNLSHDFYRSIFPTVSGIQNSKIAITSTPKGYNLFWELLSGAEKPEGDPEKNTYASMRVYWHEVPGRFTTYLRLNDMEMDKYNITATDIVDWLLDMGFEKEEYDSRGIITKHGISVKEVTSMSGNKTEIHIPNTSDFIPPIIQSEIAEKDWENPLSDFMRSSYYIQQNGDNIIKHKLLSIADISSWREDAIKDIGSVEAFNQEYDLQFLTGAKMILDSNTMSKIENNITDFEHIEFQPIIKKLHNPYENLVWTTDTELFDPSKMKEYFMTAGIDISEGLGGDFSVINLFRLMLKDLDKVGGNIKSIYDLFKLEQVGVYHDNRTSVEELGELAYVLLFEVLNPDQVSVVLESNNWGNELIKTMKEMYKGYNEFSSHIFCRYKHRADASKRSIGIKLRQNKNMFVKEYQKRIKRGDINIHHLQTMQEMTKFIKKDTASGNVKFEADAGAHDDIVMTIVEMSSVFDNLSFHELIMSYMETLDSETLRRIDAVMGQSDMINEVDYSIVKDAMSRANVISSFNNMSGHQSYFK